MSQNQKEPLLEGQQNGGEGASHDQLNSAIDQIVLGDSGQEGGTIPGDDGAITQERQDLWCSFVRASLVARLKHVLVQ